MFLIKNVLIDQIHDDEVEKQLRDKLDDIAYGNDFCSASGFFAGKVEYIDGSEDGAENTDGKIGRSYFQHFFRYRKKAQYRFGKRDTDQHKK